MSHDLESGIISLMNIDTAQCRSGLCANVKYFFTRLRSRYWLSLEFSLNLRAAWGLILLATIFFRNIFGKNIFSDIHII